MSYANCSHSPCFLPPQYFPFPLQLQPSSLQCGLMPDSDQRATLSVLPIAVSASLSPSNSSGIPFCVDCRTPQISVQRSSDRRKSKSMARVPDFARHTNRFSAKSPVCGRSRGLACKNPFLIRSLNLTIINLKERVSESLTNT
jgi:hypothetical protein